jgi:hypothetical protein
MPPMRLGQLRSGMQAYARAFDADVLTAADAARVVEQASAIERMAATVMTLAAVRVARTKAWASGGDRSAAHQLARTTGVSVSEAQATLQTGARLAEQPAVAEAARAGKLSAAQTAAITDAVAANPNAEARLVEQAAHGSLGELRDHAAKAKAQLIDLEARRRRNHERRGTRTYTDAEGLAHLHWADNPERIAEFMGELEPRIDDAFRVARKERRRESREAHAADAMLALARDARGGGKGAKQSRSVKILARVDLPRFLRDEPGDDDEVCEIVGYGPVPVSAIRALMDSGDPFLAAVVTNGKQVLGVAHLGRKFTAHQQTALEWLNPTCAVEGCNSLARLEYDHREDWADTHFSLVDLADRICRYHHQQKTHDGWALVIGTGKRVFVPSEDPRHPKRAGTADANAPPSAA